MQNMAEELERNSPLVERNPSVRKYIWLENLKNSWNYYEIDSNVILPCILKYDRSNENEPWSRALLQQWK